MIAIVNYGMGNLRSVQKAFEHIGAKAAIVHRPEEIDNADRVVLPGVGAFGDAMDNLKTAGLIAPIVKAIAEGRPFLGICLGLQLMFAESEEMGQHQRIGHFAGRGEAFSQGAARAANWLEQSANPARDRPVGRRARWVVFLFCTFFLRGLQAR